MFSNVNFEIAENAIYQAFSAISISKGVVYHNSRKWLSIIT